MAVECQARTGWESDADGKDALHEPRVVVGVDAEA
jgi:hypothetical protein